MRFVVLFLILALCSGALCTPLDDYVNLPDKAFKYSYTGVTREGNGWTAYAYNMTSQTWLTSKDTDRTVWWHWLMVIVPHAVNKTLDTSLLFITGGENKDTSVHGIPGVLSELTAVAVIATKARSTAAILYQVPNQPVVFAADPHHSRRIETSAMAFAWWCYLHVKPDPYYLMELPMTKSAVRAMDALEGILPKYIGYTIKKFVVGGASKRGWATWLTGAVDKRVVAMFPIVLDALNLHAFFHRQWRFYGNWTFALEDYWNMNITADLDSPNVAKILAIVDPWYYRQRLTMPKLALNAVGDEFQMPDDQRHWAHDMPGEMNLIMVKNAEHSMATGILELAQSAGAFYEALLASYSRPSYTWSIDNRTGEITMSTPIPPKSVTVAYADSAMGVSAGKRDFRWAALNAQPCSIKVFGACVRVIWWKTQTNVTQVNSTTWKARMDPPEKGWRGFMIEMQWVNPTGEDDFYFTSPVSVVPNTYPFAGCSGAGCRGNLC